MKLVEYQTYDDFVIIKFENNFGDRAEFTVREKGITVECDGLSLNDLKKAIEIIESGKIEIKL
jgi:hypothetical protein